MAIVNPPPWLQNSGATNSAQLLRIGAGSSVKGPTASTPNSISGKGGVVVRPGTAGTLAVSQNGGGNMSVNVASGVAYVRGTENVYQGGYWVLNDATVNLAVATSDPTNARTDSVYIAIRDAFYSGVNNDSVLTVATGNPATPTTPPTLPVNSLELYRINVRAATTSILTSDLTDRRPWLTAQGGITPLRSFETTDPGTADGDPSYISPTGLRLWDSGSTVWRATPHFVAALTDITNNATPKTEQITYNTNASTRFWYRWNGSSFVQAPAPTGMMAWARRTTSSSTTTTTVIGVLRIDDIPIYANRVYEVKASFVANSTVSTDSLRCEIRYTSDTSTPTVTSAIMAGMQIYTGLSSKTMYATYVPAGDETLSILLCIVRDAGTGNAHYFGDGTRITDMTIMDCGPSLGNVGTNL